MKTKQVYCIYCSFNGEVSSRLKSCPFCKEANALMIKKPDKAKQPQVHFNVTVKEQLRIKRIFNKRGLFSEIGKKLIMNYVEKEEKLKKLEPINMED